MDLFTLRVQKFQLNLQVPIFLFFEKTFFIFLKIFEFTGTMAGAVHAGHRAAIEVLDRLRPQSLTSQDYFFLKQSHSKLYEDKAKSTANRYSSHFGIWTFLIPSMAFVLAWGALKLRSTHGILFVPR